jgi:predicted AlkP superfamily pyrophosphatase or phosphodiesterase
MHARRLLRVIPLTAALSIAVAGSIQAQRQPADGRLLVIVVVDQMRFDYLDRFRGLFKEGIARLLNEGAIFERASYPYLNTVTCPGHATIGTGAFPSTHGIIMNDWWQRSERRRLSCTNDPTVKPLPYSGQGEPTGHSGYRLRIPSFGDRLRARWPESRVVTLSMKPRSTVMLAGHGGTAVTWLSDTNSWATSTAFATELVPAVQAYVDANPLERYRTEVWTPVNDIASYHGPDDGIGERGPAGWTPLFPHPLAGRPGTRPERFFELWERSPYSDAALGDMAAHLVRTLQLGQRGAVDYLGVSFSALDYVGHDFGPDSIEVQDTLIRLDRTLGALLTALDTTVGAGKYTIGLSADHGVAPIPESLVAQGLDAGRVINAELQKIAEAAMTAAHGPGPHVAHVEYAELYLTD